MTLKAQTVTQMVDAVLAMPEGSKLMLLAPVVRDRKGEHLHVFEQMRAAGFIRVRVDGIVVDLDDVPTLDKRKNTVLMWWWTVSKSAMTSSFGWQSHSKQL